jgi:hypothetical protein
MTASGSVSGLQQITGRVAIDFIDSYQYNWIDSYR